ncbi:MAG: hypothetical protein ACO1SX_25565, partial [Actinomycetota bacterium]
MRCRIVSTRRNRNVVSSAAPGAVKVAEMLKSYGKKVITGVASKLVATMSRYRRPHLVLPSVLFAGALALGAFAQGPPGSAPGAGAPARPEMGDFFSRGDEWAWIVKAGEKTRLMTGGPGGAGKLVAEGSGWSDVAVSAGQFWLLQNQGDRSRLLRAPKAGGEPREVLA